MTTLSSHVLDTGTGQPAAGMRVHLSSRADGGWERIADVVTDDDGRCSFGEVADGVYRLGFETGEYGNDMYPFVHVVFRTRSQVSVVSAGSDP